MRTPFYKTRRFLRPTKRLLYVTLLLSLVFFSFFFSACKKSKINYFSYVSELRSNIFYAETDGFSLRIFATEKEYPYSSDGVKRDTSVRTEIYLFAPSGDKTTAISFSIDETPYGGEMSYDNVKAEYYYSCTLDVSALSQIDCVIDYGGKTLEFCAQSVKTENTLTPQTVIEKLQESESELLASLTDKYGFAGEIYVRLLYEDFPYYYIGVIDRNGNTTAFLMNGETGKILAKRQS
ncbi:MAG: hypothetical protein IJ329_04240 [Clostridia bacterium]|nr:hypothetical protein [Clostridia bacterium]